MPHPIPTTADEVRRLFLQRLGLRIGPETASYVLRRLEAGPSAPAIPVMGGDARTGVPVRVLVEPSRVTAGPASLH